MSPLHTYCPSIGGISICIWAEATVIGQSFCISYPQDSEDPELNEILRKAIKGEEAYREHLPHEESEQ